jgi:hypothetical protein
VRRDLRLRDSLIGVGHAEADDAAPLALDHARRDEPREIEHRVKVVVEHLLPAGDGFVQERDSAVWAGAVDEGVDAAELRGDSGDKLFAIARVRHVGVDRQRGRAFSAHRSRCLSRSVAARPVTECDRPALSGELEPDAAPDAFGAASDQRDAWSVRHITCRESPH